MNTPLPGRQQGRMTICRDKMNWDKLAPAIQNIVEEAGMLAFEGFREGRQTTSRIWYKDGGSPVTASDIAANDLLEEKLQKLLPEAAWLSEETTDHSDRLSKNLVWIVDPIDGTRAFLSGHPDWCVSVALLADGQPVIGSIFAPALQIRYSAVQNNGAERNGRAMAVSTRPTLADARIAGPKPMIAAVERVAGPAHRLARIPSLALRLARVAEGSIDVGLVSGMARDWDIAAADLILREAGGIMTGLSGEAVRYNNPFPTHGELAASSKLLHSSLIETFA